MDNCRDDNRPGGSRLELPEINLLVGARAEDDRLNAVEVDIVDAAEVSGQLVEDLPGGGLPHVHIPVGTAGRHHGAIGRPCAVQQVLLEVV